MRKKINFSIIVAAVSAILFQQQIGAQEAFQQPVVLFNNSQLPTPFGSSVNPFTHPYVASGFGFAPGLVTGYSPLAYGSGYSGFGRNWIRNQGGFGGFGGYGGYGNFGYPGGFGLGGLGGNPFTGGGGYGNFGYPGAFGGYGGFGGGYPGGFGWGGYGGNPFTGGGNNFSPFSSSHELGMLGGSQVIQIGPSKASGNYYQPSTVDSSASGSYYASTSAPAQQAAPVSPRPSHSGWTSPSGDGNFWGSSGNGMPKDLNSVPWNK